MKVVLMEREGLREDRRRGPGIDEVREGQLEVWAREKETFSSRCLREGG